MQIVEHFIMGKTGDPDLCEDGLVVSEYFTAVIDGATNISSVLFNSRTPGRIAMDLIKETIGSLEAETSAWDAERIINRRIYSWYEQNNVLETMRRFPEQRCTASAVIYSDARRELWLVGDCHALLNGVLYQPDKKVDRLLSELRAMLICLELSRGKTETELLMKDTGREKILDFMRMQMELQNAVPENEFTYYVFDGFPCESPNRLKIVPVDRQNGEIVLASDGYPKIFASLSESEDYLAQILREDPLCYKLYRTTKGRYGKNLSFDDRSYIRFRY